MLSTQGAKNQVNDVLGGIIMYEWKKKRARKDYESYELRTPGLKIDVFNGHIDCPGEWLMNCFILNIPQFSLEVKTAQEAKEKAIKIVKTKLIQMVNGLGEILK